MVINFESTFVTTDDGQPIVVFLSGVMCNLKKSQIFMGFFSMCLNYNMVKIKFYCLSITNLTKQGEFELYNPMG